MAQILSFRTKPKASGEPGHDENFLHHEDYTLSFQVTESGHIGLGNSLPDCPTTEDNGPAGACSDWTNQEMADLFRVKRLLDAAGVTNELERGLTDEGDPWLVFCGQDGEVFIHLCRLEGVYVLDSPNIPVPLRGADFNGLIEAFTHRNLPRTDGPVDPSDNRVIRIRRGGKVQLHPSALLAALIWTLLLAAEDLVLMAPGAKEAEEGLTDLEALSQNGENDLPEEPFWVSEKGPSSADTAIEAVDADPRQITAHELFLKENSNGLTLTQNSYGMGLSTIAIAFGFMTEQSTFDHELLMTQTAVFLSTLDEDIDEDGETKVALLEEAETTPTFDTEIHTVELGEIAQDVGSASDRTEDKLPLTAVEAVADTKAFTEQLQQVKSKIAQAEIRSSDSDRADETPLPASNPTPAPQKTPTQVAAVVPEKNETSVEALPASPTISGMSLSTLRTAFQPSEMKSYSFGGTVIKSSFELTEETLKAMPFLELPMVGNTETFGLGSLLDQEGPEVASSFRSFDEEARSFMSYLLAKTDKVEMISVSNAEIILIDSGALSMGEIYSASWETSDGSVISMVGLRSEFQDFDLIA